MPSDSSYFVPTRKRKEDVWSLLGLPSRGQAILAAVDNGLEADVCARLAILLEMDERSFNKRLGISEATMRRRKKKGRLTSAESDKVFRIAKVYGAVLGLFEGDQAAANAWMQAPSAALNGKPPVEMFGTSVESDSLLELIGRLEHGVFV